MRKKFPKIKVMEIHRREVKIVCFLRKEEMKIETLDNNAARLSKTGIGSSPITKRISLRNGTCFDYVA
ncbi:hypothetical protein AB3N58_12990 [Leptospira sp. WS60.C2]